ncbi:unnamed protein product [Acanthosepion pharaonis]|uniref:DUF7041 domain-containing protein n=1 Tax=Acanthosepion pharaonis TaxID=158019 RepID=A0A812BW35_ACAPH|nr:unnamed protein product [Sepia pharaonis]
MSAAVAPFPPFHEGNIKNWFLQMEAIFTVRRITDQKTKFGHVVAVLPPAIVDEVSDFLEAVPEVEPYARTPSQLLRYMKSRLSKNTMADSILKSLWLDRLPTTITQILAPMSENTSIDQLADAADRIFSQLDNQTTPVHSAEATGDHRSLEKTVEELQRQVKDLTLALKSRGRSRFPSAGASEVDHARPAEIRMPLLLCVTTTEDLGLKLITASSRVLILRSRKTKPPATVTTPPVSSSFIQDLRLKMANLCYTPPWHCPSDIYLPHQLKDCEFVFVRNDSVKRPLTPAYTGPYRVLKRADKYFQIQKGIHTDNVSIDRLKPAFIEKPSSHTTSQSTPQVQENFKTPVSLDKPKYTSSGRKVTFPKKFETFYYY